MNLSYGIVWREGTLPLATGKLEFLARGVRLDGLVGSRRATLELGDAALAGIRIGRTAGERLDGRPTLILERRSGPPIRITSVPQSSLLADIAERLAALIYAPAAG
jgi:hypothetical protein